MATGFFCEEADLQSKEPVPEENNLQASQSTPGLASLAAEDSAVGGRASATAQITKLSTHIARHS